MKSFRPKKDDLQKKFIFIDLQGLVLGRVCARIAHLLRGKHKCTFTPGVNCGDHVVVINSDKIVVTGNKLRDNIYYKHTGYIGNLREIPLGVRMKKDSTEVIKTAVKRMLPRGPLGRAQLRMLHVYPESGHTYNSVRMTTLNAEEFRRV